MAARSIRSPPACCRSPSARRPRPCPTSWTAPSCTASPCASARRATPTTPTASHRDLRRPPDRRRDRGGAAGVPRRRSCRSRRSSPPSRLPASGPTTWRARAAPPVLEPRPARVDRFELVERPDADTAMFEVPSGKGVYMRSLARDLALACGTLGHIAALRRLRVGPFTEAQAIPLDKLARAGGYPARFPGPSASGRDRAGRHPGAGPDRSGGQPACRMARRSAWSTLMGRIPGGRSRWRVGPSHGGEPRDRAVPAARMAG